MGRQRPFVVTVFYCYCGCGFLTCLLSLSVMMFSEISPLAIIVQKFTWSLAAAIGLISISAILSFLPFILPLKRSTWIYHIIFFVVPLHLTGKFVLISPFEHNSQIVWVALFGLIKILVLYLYLQPKVIEYFEHGAEPIDPRVGRNPA